MQQIGNVADRVREREVMDRPDLDQDLHQQALTGLARLNWLSGSVGLVWSPIAELGSQLGRPLSVLDLATGGGDIPLGLWRRARRTGLDLEMTWRIGNHGFQMTLSPRVPDLIGAHLRPWLEAWLASLGRRLEDLNSWAVHPGGPRILTSVAKALGLSEATLATSAEILAECGNMSSPTVLFILQRLQQQGARLPCLALGFGPGLVAEAALLE